MWEPPDDVVALMPDVSGNSINGLDEVAPRRPTKVMWANPATLAHGAVQRRMTEQFARHRELSTVIRMDDRHEPVPVADSAERDTPRRWTERVTGFATEEADHRVELVGVAAVRQEWFYDGQEDGAHASIIVLGVAMDHAELATAPEHTSAMEVHRQYNRGTHAAREVADWIRSRGYDAEGHGGPGAGPMLLIPAAIEAGFGELGKHGSIINRRFGSSFRLAGVLTSLPLEPTTADRIGADEFCHGCRVCTDACPPDAIGPDKRVVRGVEKWYVDFDRCLPYFAVSHGCGICIAVCPWSTPGEGPRLADNMLRKLDLRGAG